ncbi:MAG: transcription elongation factor GreA, partial [bacterium]|nr:transcription elongation factor GreA [bacterium]
MSENKSYLTDEGHKKLKEELEHLKKVRRPEISERIKQAKDYGDLSENAEYADAREEQSF